MDPRPRQTAIRHSWWFSSKQPPEQPVVRHAQPGSDIAVGERSFGKASVNCCLRGNKSKWGTLQGGNAAVLQLRVDPAQNPKYKLKELVLELDFSEMDPRVATSNTTAASAQPSLLILEPPSPKHLRGKALIQHLSQEFLAQPQVGAGGFSIGGIGLKSTKDKDIERSWRFHSHWTNNASGHYTSARWTWTAVSENPDIENVGALYLGIIIRHPNKPFYLTCKINGKLVNIGRRFRYGDDGEPSILTLVYPQTSQQSIEKEAKELENEIVALIEGEGASKSLESPPLKADPLLCAQARHLPHNLVIASNP
ncbi:hypothetical protein AYL99_07971 [Fonsecaea erecta]|uniref:Uncharacterized protein n=1 Tax=Fonsecaea erecta TaxID=1367422 RepID=A0A178ZDI4_9EURO|nr:hypothetical protein AYL99_07971 [Fonsecaea erecta]OAP57233.1 hypothetical protein AYL99_07971 [Fonsecaea erecta]